MDKALQLLTLGLEAIDLARKLFSGTASHDDHRRVDEILAKKSASEQAAEDIERGRP